jgi:hypothetical protein
MKFLPAVANLNAPTAPELAAGTDLTPQIADIGGFQFQNNPISTPDLANVFVTQIPGEDTADNPTLTFYDDDASATIRTALAKGAAGFLALMPYGQVSTKRAEIWPVTSTGVADEWSAGNDPARFSVTFAVTAAPRQSAVLP